MYTYFARQMTESLQRSRNHDETEDSWILCTPLRKLNANHFDTKNKTYAHTLSHRFSLGNYSLMISHIWNGSFIAAIVKRKRLDFFFALFWNCVVCVCDVFELSWLLIVQWLQFREKKEKYLFVKLYGTGPNETWILLYFWSRMIACRISILHDQRRNSIFIFIFS